MQLARLGKYRIVAKIGEGGMGSVYRAHDPLLNRDVAIKTMAAGADTDGDLRRRFLREAQSAASLNHRNVITILDFGEEHGHLFIAMELLDGSDLKEVMGRKRKLSAEDKLDLVDQICDGLAFAHAHGVIHRDLKPANIHVQRNGQVKIVDFGLARVTALSVMTRAGTRLGTPNYMSPELVRGDQAGTRSDVFSLGVVFYELLAERKAFDSRSTGGVLLQVMQDDPPPLEAAHPELAPFAGPIRRAMRKDPALRFETAGELRAALRDARKGTPFDLGRSLRLVPGPLALAVPPAPVRAPPPKPAPAPVVIRADPAPEPESPEPVPASKPFLPLWVFGLGAIAIVVTTLLGFLVLGYLLLARPWLQSLPPTAAPSTRRTGAGSPLPRPSPTQDPAPAPSGGASPDEP